MDRKMQLAVGALHLGKWVAIDIPVIAIKASGERLKRRFFAVLDVAEGITDPMDAAFEEIQESLNDNEKAIEKIFDTKSFHRFDDLVEGREWP